MRGRAVCRWAVTIVVAASGLTLAPPAEATSAPVAAACTGATGVTAFVDFAELGGGVTGGCDRGGGDRPAVEVFRDVGYTLEYSQAPGMNGFVCKVQGKPTDGDCSANDSFWSLWWSDGESGRWVFSNRGVGALEVPDGGYVAWAWHEGTGRAEPPAVIPTAHPDDEPTDDGDGDGDDNGNTDSGQSDGTTSGAPTTTTTEASTATTAPVSESTSGAGMPDDTGTSREADSDEPAPDSSESTVPGAAEITDGPPPTDLATETGDDGGAVSTWIGLGLAVLVLGAAGVVTVLRRRAG